ncbi:MAG: saccharopine dehydrogenase NADP-binding domain-containing protein [Myxococcales bacterium]|jgi:short subunit dehydrogenase-like uncharacterized protein|nr:saccharopine dehydrogenase NADP-binding domain-containing protein [Myxococcales bacterium]MBL0197164.1 saccharopine dehydrogenase NADP-binding domain-containing protein [Myxococcales bacterium]
MARTYDLVLFGATGFTGKLVAEYLAKHATGLAWAVAGRSEAKLREVLDGIDRGSAAGGKRVGLLVADAADAESLKRVVTAARVVVTTVGPYAKYGQSLARAAAEHGTHYCDITGEVPFVRRSIDENHARARETGARLVHCCGFDSIPSDLGVLLLADRARELDTTLEATRLVVLSAKGGFSGGTAASMMNLMREAERDRALRRLLRDPYSLTPDRASELTVDGPDPVRVRWDEDAKVWTGPFIMAAINTRVVRRSNALLDHRYGRAFGYEETMSFSRGPRGLAKAGAFVAGLGATMLAASREPSRAVLERFLPKPGEGPSKAQRDGGFFRIAIYAKTSNGARLEARVEGTSDPGYGETAKMLAESALALAGGELSSAEGGVLTPAAALGQGLIARLRAAGMTFELKK